MATRPKTISSRILYRGRVFDLRADLVSEPGGSTARRELVCHRGSVVVMPILPGGRVLLVRQYRHAARKSLWELVAGTLEPRESALHAARRELREETGYTGKKFKHLLSFFPSPGILTERMHLFKCRVSKPSAPRPESDERIECRAFSPAGLWRMARQGEIEDAKTLIGIAWALSGPHGPRLK